MKGFGFLELVLVMLLIGIISMFAVVMVLKLDGRPGLQMSVSLDPDPTEFGTGHATAYTETFMGQDFGVNYMGQYGVNALVQAYWKKFGFEKGRAFHSLFVNIY